MSGRKIMVAVHAIATGHNEQRVAETLEAFVAHLGLGAGVTFNRQGLFAAGPDGTFIPAAPGNRGAFYLRFDTDNATTDEQAHGIGNARHAMEMDAAMARILLRITEKMRSAAARTGEKVNDFPQPTAYDQQGHGFISVQPLLDAPHAAALAFPRHKSHWAGLLSRRDGSDFVQTVNSQLGMGNGQQR
jgi:hypothetical protein